MLASISCYKQVLPLPPPRLGQGFPYPVCLARSSSQSSPKTHAILIWAFQNASASCCRPSYWFLPNLSLPPATTLFATSPLSTNPLWLKYLFVPRLASSSFLPQTYLTGITSAQAEKLIVRTTRSLHSDCGEWTQGTFWALSSEIFVSHFLFILMAASGFGEEKTAQTKQTSFLETNTSACSSVANATLLTRH
jgi:hypothetical protein